MFHYQKTHWFKVTPFRRLYKQKIYDGKKVSLWSTSKDQKQVQSPRKKDEDTYEVRVEGRSKEGLVSFSK
jgi:hypothetical protein